MGLAPGRATNDPMGYFAFGKQTLKGTRAGTFFFTKHLDGSAFEVEKEISREREGGDGQNVGLTYVTMVKADGSLNANARPGILGRVAAAVQGADSIPGGAPSGLTRHVAVPAASLPYFTIQQRFADVIEDSVDSVFTEFDLEGEAGKPFKLTANYLSGASISSIDVASSLTVVRETGKPFFYPGGSYIMDGQASYANDLTKVKVNIKRGVDDGIQTTGLGRDDVIALNYDVQVDATVKFTSRDLYKAIKYNGGSQLLQDLPTGSIDLAQNQKVSTGGGSTALALFRLQVPLIEWTDARVNKLDPDGKTMYVDLVGMNVAGPTHACIITTDTLDASAY